MDKIPVVYIMSEAYSGSTLLDLLLGMTPEIWTLGEAQHLWQRVQDQQVCACGELIPKCPFWEPLLQHIPTTDQKPAKEILWLSAVRST